MLLRCTHETRLRRFHGNVGSFPEAYLTEAVAETAEHFALVVETSGAVAALASCRAVANDAAELAVIVEDSHQRQGIGSCLLGMLLDHAERSGLRTLRATVLVDQEWVLGALRSYGTCQALVSFGVLDVTLQPGPGPIHQRIPGVTTEHSRGAAVGIEQLDPEGNPALQEDLNDP